MYFSEKVRGRERYPSRLPQSRQTKALATMAGTPQQAGPEENDSINDSRPAQKEVALHLIINTALTWDRVRAGASAWQAVLVTGAARVLTCAVLPHIMHL